MTKINKDSLVYSLAGLGDLLALQKLLRSLYKGESPWSTTIFGFELSKKKNVRYIKAVYNKKIIGFAGARIEGEDAHITNIGVATSFQGLGIGTQLILKLEEYAKRNLCNTMSLEVMASNNQAISLYQSLGFKKTKLKENYYTREGEDAYEMCKTL